jgi:uncharacterized membrane protein
LTYGPPVLSRRLELEEQRVRERIEKGDPYWPPQLAIGVAIGLNFTLTERITIGPTWLLPAVELVLLLVLVVVAPRRATAHAAGRRHFALAVVGFVSLTNVVSLSLLVHYLVNGGKAGGHALIGSGAALWLTSVLLFSVWYWELDRGGPVVRFLRPDVLPDFQFPQMENPQLAPQGWRPGFLDYLYLSLTNAMAFSPTDAMPLTHTAKTVMALQSVAALVTVGLVVARAVNVLG